MVAEMVPARLLVGGNPSLDQRGVDCPIWWRALPLTYAARRVTPCALGLAGGGGFSGGCWGWAAGAVGWGVGACDCGRA
eukprot:6483544-Amphidinium_carterae.1